ncbi:hypothetical protein VHEMI06346 [[Torrubiella] hemipterigena]|uniref:acylphosphatase n=1 Tax=[Torrubiella] hemipterigena TaxID=1531966 RepID=A0A0A1TJ65_9HYPO|nr:hypothetical protein VHEMI06346 [[Torrubiella] hemipterigena]
MVTRVSCTVCELIQFIIFNTRFNIDLFCRLWRHRSRCRISVPCFLDAVSACINANFDRYFTRKKAQLHGITGWCRNTTDSNVEGEAQGGDEAMVKFLKDLHTGPQHAVVAKVTQEDRQTVEGEDTFAIRH